jgi:ATP-dependent Lhr-like helicase
VLPEGVPAALAAAVADPLGDLVARYARTHAPFTVDALAGRFGLGVAPVRAVLQRLAAADRVLAGEFTAGRRGEEWCDAGVLRALKGRSLARLRREVEPVDAAAFGRFLPDWQRVIRPRSGSDALLAVVAQLQGAPLLASSLDGEVLAARVRGYRPEHLDRLCAAGEVRWAGLEAVGANDGRIALYLADAWPLLARPARVLEAPLADRVRALLAARGALFFSDLVGETGVFPTDLLAMLWQLVWAGEVTNDTLVPLRKLVRGGVSDQRRRAPPQGLFRARRLGPPGSEGRWSLLPAVGVAMQAGARDMSGGPGGGPSETARAAALAGALLDRHGVVTREAVQAEDIAGGFSAVYAVLGAMEAAGKVRRGYFVAGLGAAQFAAPGADDRLRSLRDAGETSVVCVLASTDPANPYGAALAWPERAGARLARAAHTRVVLVDGALVAHVAKDARSVITFLPEAEPQRGDAAAQVARAVAGLAVVGRNVVLAEIDGVAAQLSPLTATFERAGFAMTSQGLFIRGSGEQADDDAS